VKVEFAPEARRQIAAFAAWWDDHRKDARVRVEDALEAAVGALAEHPGLGRPYSVNPTYRTRRLKGTPYVLFYRVDEAAETIRVVSAWSGVRGSGPELP
jgi:plasmid stabilization system protein ParE